MTNWRLSMKRCTLYLSGPISPTLEQFKRFSLKPKDT